MIDISEFDKELISARVAELNAQIGSLNISHSQRYLDLSQTQSAPSFTPLWQLPQKLPVFTGRKQPLLDLKRLFIESQQLLLIQQTPQITGTGGIGKTQLAVQFVHQLLTEKLVQTVVWLNADTSVIDQANIEFLRLAHSLGIDTKFLDHAEVVRSVYLALSQQPKVIVILDGATKYQDISKYCPPHNNGIRLLVTTRDDQPWDKHFAQLPLGIFSPEEALDYIRTVLASIKVSDTDAERLASCLGHFPLALAQATSYIITRNINISDYIGLYNSKKSTQQKLLEARPLVADPHQESLWVTVNLSLEFFKGEDAQNIIAAISYLVPENPILSHFFVDWTQNADLYNIIITSMRQYGLITTSQDQNSFKIHKMVQEVIKLNFDVNKKLNIFELLVKKLFFYTFHEYDPVECGNRLLAMRAHAEAVNIELAKNKFFDDIGLGLLFALLETQVIEAKSELGHDKEVIERGVGILEFLDTIPKLAQHVTLYLLNTLGRSYQHLGDANNALFYYRRAQKIIDDQLPDVDKSVSPCNINIASSYLILGRIADSRKILQDMYIKIGAGADDCSETFAHLLINLAGAYRESGEPFKAVTLLKRAIEVRTKRYGEHHRHVQITIRGLVVLYLDISEPELALPLIMKVHDVLEAYYGNDHVEIASTLDAMGVVYCALGQLHEAKRILQRALTIRIQIYGLKHPEVARTKFNLGNALIRLASIRDAGILLEEALAIQKEYYGSYSPDVGRTLLIIGYSYQEFAQYDKALESMLLAIKILERNFGLANHEVGKAYSDISCVYSDRGSFVLAREAAEKALRILEGIFGPCHPDVARALNNLANAVRLEKTNNKKGQLDAAISLLKRSISTFEQTFGINHLEVARPLTNLGAVHLQLNKLIEAKENYQRALQISIQSYNTLEHPEIANLQFRLATVEVKLRNYTVAKDLCANALMFFHANLGSNNTLTREAYKLHNLLEGVKIISPQKPVDIIDTILDGTRLLDIQTCITLVDCCFKIDQPKIALQLLDSVQDGIHRPDIKRLMIRCYLDMVDVDAAMRLVDFSKDKDLVDTIKEADKWNKNLRLLVSAINTNSQLTDKMKIQQAQLLIQLKDFSAAVKLLQPLVDQQSSPELSGPALYYLALSHYYLQEYDLASKYLARSQKIQDKDRIRDLFVKISLATSDLPKLQMIVGQLYPGAIYNN